MLTFTQEVPLCYMKGKKEEARKNMAKWIRATGYGDAFTDEKEEKIRASLGMNYNGGEYEFELEIGVCPPEFK